MKKISYMKKALLQATFVATALLMVSCDNTNKTDGTKEVAAKSNNAKFDNTTQEKDAKFLVNAAEISLEEIQLGKLAQQKGTTPDVKALGKMMEDAHTKSLNDLQALARSKRISIPTSLTNDAKDAYSELNEETGSAFDKAYTDMMVSEHKDAISAFEDASTAGKDKDIKEWARNSLPGLRTHLDRSIDCQKKISSL